MPDPRRSKLQRLHASKSSNARLAFNLLLNSHDKGAYARHAKSVAAIRVSKVYETAYDDWADAMEALCAKMFDVVLDGPLVTGTGNVSLTDIGITLSPTYGVPLIPGTGIKGMCRRAARDADGLSPDQIAVLFGSSEDSDGDAPEGAGDVEVAGEESEGERGYVTFWDAWLKPGQPQPLMQDVLTPHHPDYYAKKCDGHGGVVWPSPSDDPNPVAFLSVKPGTHFTFALSAPDAPDYLPLAEEILGYALKVYGVGAKTNVGYGRATMELTPGDAGAL